MAVRSRRGPVDEDASRALQQSGEAVEHLRPSSPGAFGCRVRPFGGYKQSGWGREMGHEALEAYTEIKAVTTLL